jgi:hypothetical protein
MRTRADRGQVIATFKRHGWVWLGMGDPPHFEVPVESIGEPNKLAMIRKAQADFQAGNPAGCRAGVMSAPSSVPSGEIPPEERRRRAREIYS